ncbi:MAG: carboxypeptidase Y-deficient [Cirrosporium novae-zelandiae]|nr:MAG: carboxypeptidase Y-deficient [Cirrosporium novae-zelandiae]
MSRRILGGGRVLGSGNSLPPPSVGQASKPSSYPLSPTASSASLNSQVSNPHAPNNNQDISSRISLDNPDAPNPAAIASASARLVCPICNEEMNLEEVRQDEVKDWFKTQMIKAKRFQPLAVLNQKLKGLDVFESNDTLPPPTPSSASYPAPEVSRPNPDEVVTREHWQKYSDVCSDPTCGKRLNVANGNINCRKCGKLFCDDHTMYQMKLSRSANHEPVRGFWCRVCETCYKSREGYNDHSGLEVDHTQYFAKTRRPIVDKSYLEVSRLEKRLTKLTQMLADMLLEHGQANGGLKWSLPGVKNQRKDVEQSVVTWEDDSSVSKCPFCQQEFTSYTFRRHHCRLCGRVVCGDPRTECSTEVGLNVATEKSGGQIGVDVRLCKDCRHTLFSKRDFDGEIASKPAVARSYENLVQFERGIRIMLPKFQRLLQALQDPVNPPSHAQLTEASKVRKRLMDSFTQFDIAARRIRDFPTKSPSEQRLQKAIYQRAASFLHIHMLPLKALPKVLKHASPHGLPDTRLTANGKPRPALAAIKYNDIDASSQASGSSVVSLLEAEEKSLRERLIVLEEQKFFVSEMVVDANKRRKFDEVSTLAQNLEDLSKEIDQVNGMIGHLDFEGAYTGMSPASPP